jgi:3-oxoacyl-[acyl-carrier-protein] synthase II
LANVLRALLRSIAREEVGHINAHGLSTKSCDAEEAQAIAEVFGERSVPVVAAKSYFGNLGAGSGMVELISSVLAMQNGRLFRTLNYEQPDTDCPVCVVDNEVTPAGAAFINLSVTPQGQASGLLVRKF